MRPLRRHANLVVLTRTIRRLAILARHDAANHSHRPPDLTHLTVNPDFRSFIPPSAIISLAKELNSKYLWE